MMRSSTENDADRVVANQPVWLLVLVLVALYTCAFIDRNILSLLVDPIKADLHVDDVKISLLLGVAFSVFYGILNVPAGLMVDRYGRRGLIAGAALCWSAMTIVCALATTYAQLFVGRMGVGIAEALIAPATFSLLRDRVPLVQRGRAFSAVAMAPYIGGALALMSGGALIGLAGSGYFDSWPVVGKLRHWQLVLLFVGVGGLPLSMLLLLLAPDVRDPARHGPAQGSLFGLPAALAHIRADRLTYLLLTGYATAGAMLAFGNGAWVPAMMSRRFARPIAHIGLVSGPIVLVASITGLLVGGLILDQLSRAGRSVMAYGLVAVALTTVLATLTPLVPGETLAWVFYGATIFFAGTFYSTGAIILSQITPSAVMGKVTALYLLCQTLIGSALGPTIIAIMSTRFTGKDAIAQALSLYCAVAGLLGIAMAYGLTRRLGRVHAAA